MHSYFFHSLHRSPRWRETSWQGDAAPVFRCRRMVHSLSISGILTCAVVAVGTGSSSGAGAGVGLGAAAGAELVWLVVLLELFVWLDLLPLNCRLSISVPTISVFPSST